MIDMANKHTIEILGPDHISGTPHQVKILEIRINELIRLNGEKWVKENKMQLIHEWEYVIKHFFNKGE